MKLSTTLSTSSTAKARRVLLLADRLHAIQEHVDPLLHSGYEVDCTYCSRRAWRGAGTRTYDLILIALRRRPPLCRSCAASCASRIRARRLRAWSIPPSRISTAPRASGGVDAEGEELFHGAGECAGRSLLTLSL